MNASPLDLLAEAPAGQTTLPSPDRRPDAAVKMAEFLLLSDHALLRHGLREALQRKPALHLAGEFVRAGDALDTCEALQPAFMIVAGVAYGSPLEVVRQAATRQLRTKFIVILDNVGPSTVRDAFDAGVHGCLSPRSTLGMLEEAIRAVVTGRTFWCPEVSRILIEAMRTGSGRREALTPRDRELLLGIARSEPVKVIADRLGISAKTAANRLTALKAQLGLPDGAGIARYAIRTGLLDPSEC